MKHEARVIFDWAFCFLVTVTLELNNCWWAVFLAR